MRTTPRFKALVAALLALAVLAAACSGDSTTDAGDGDGDSGSDSGQADTADSGDAGSSDGSAGTDGDEPEPEAEPEPEDEPEPEPEPEEPAGPDVRTLALMPDPVGSTDPLETVNHLPSVQVFTTEGGIAFVFDSLPEVGNRVLIAPPGLEIWCDMWPEGETVRVECAGYNMADNTFIEQTLIDQVDMALGYGFVVPMTVGGGMVTITLNGVDYSAAEVRVGQEPAFVQIDVNTGGLAAEVIRTVGIASAADLEAALA